MKPVVRNVLDGHYGHDFPGYFAGASLKHPVVVPSPPDDNCDFPGYFAGASLKRTTTLPS